ncbi:ATP-binding SpoIIE family protein phosphatase [Methylomagnum ishizawai]|nr:SpoIIE family protein phosphatase [Methylomagnum ishizawai]
MNPRMADGGKALVLHDDPSGVRPLVAGLAARGFVVVEACSGEAALEALRWSVPNIVFMDAAPLGRDCYAVARRIKAAAGGCFVPVIVLATPVEAHELVGRMEVDRDEGADVDDFLAKPVDPVQLRAKLAVFGRVARLCRTARAQQEELIFKQELARQVYAKTALADPAQLAAIHGLQRPASVFSGDILLVERSPSGALHVLVGDFTGHGLAAAIGALPAADVFRGMTAKGFAPAEILVEINRKLRRTLPTGMFLAAALVCLDGEGRWAGIRNSGLPDVLVLGGAAGSLKERVPSSSIPLGILDEIGPCELRWVAVDPGDQIVVMTDGIVEARDAQGECFGEQRVWSCLMGGGSVGAFGRLVDGLDRFTADAPQEDDLTLALIPCGRSALDPPVAGTARRDAVPSALGPTVVPVVDWHWELELGASALKRLDVVPLLVDTLVDLQGLRVCRQPVFTILSELFSNALDHGVLRLEARIKADPEGFARYFRERRERLTGLERGRIHISLAARSDADGGWLEIGIEDDGPGFDYERWRRGSRQSPPHGGRGIGLVEDLCESVEFLGTGNRVRAVYRW